MNNKNNKTDNITEELKQLEEQIESFNDADFRKGKELFKSVVIADNSLLCVMMDTKTSGITGLIINNKNHAEMIAMLIAAMDIAGVRIEELSQAYEILHSGEHRYSIN